LIPLRVLAHVVGKLLGREQAEKTARHMEYPWQTVYY
jgi:hypothetical protein